jgi:hypothetical protein
MEKCLKKEVFDFHYCVQMFFSAYNFFWVICFVVFLTCSNSASNFAFCDTHNKFFNFLILYKLFLLPLKPKSEETAQKNEKHILLICLSIPVYIYFGISDLGGYIL